MLGFLSTDSLQLYLRSRYLSRLERLKAFEEERPDLMVVVSSVRCMTNDVLMSGGSERGSRRLDSITEDDGPGFTNIEGNYWAVLQCSVYDKKNQLLLDKVNTLSAIGIDSINVKASKEGLIDVELLTMLLKRIPNYFYSSSLAMHSGFRSNVESIFEPYFFNFLTDVNTSTEQKQSYAVEKFITVCSILTEKGVIPFLNMENKIRPMILSLDFDLVYGQMDFNVQLPSLVALDVDVIQKRHLASGGKSDMTIALDDLTLKLTKVSPLNNGTGEALLELKMRSGDKPYVVIVDRTLLDTFIVREKANEQTESSYDDDSSLGGTVPYASLSSTVVLDYSERNVFSANTIIDSPALLSQGSVDSDSTTVRLESPARPSSSIKYDTIRVVPLFEMERYANTDSFFLRRDQNDSDVLNVLDAGTLIYKGRQIKISLSFEQVILVLSAKGEDRLYRPRIKALEEEDKIIASLLSFYD